MCLMIEPGAKPRIAAKDIPVLKQLEERSLGRKTWLEGPWFTYRWPLRRVQRMDANAMQRRRWRETLRRARGFDARVRAGFHSYSLGCFERLKWQNNLYEAVIPKGAKYFVGTQSGGYAGFVSNKLRVVKKCA